MAVFAKTATIGSLQAGVMQAAHELKELLYLISISCKCDNDAVIVQRRYPWQCMRMVHQEAWVYCAVEDVDALCAVGGFL